MRVRAIEPEDRPAVERLVGTIDASPPAAGTGTALYGVPPRDDPDLEREV